MTGLARHLICGVFLFLEAILCVQDAEAAGVQERFSDIYRLYSTGAYAQAVEGLNSISAPQLTPQLTKEEKIAIAYWKGLCLSRMQSFDAAVISLQEAIRLGGDYRDLQYEMGQALYASQSLKPALAAFEKSVEAKYKIGPSLYYKGFINQILEDYSVAISTYRAILRLPDDPDKVKEGSLLQIAELELNVAMAEKTVKKRQMRIAKRVIPAFQAVLDYVDTGPAADEARRSLLALQPQIAGLTEEGPKFQNGSPMPRRAFSAHASQDFKYDTNVIFQANNALIQVSNTASPVIKTDLGSRYDLIFDRKFVVAPEFDINYTRNLNRTEPTVIANDDLSATVYLRSRYERTTFGAPAALSFDIEYNYNLRDYLMQNRLPYYSSYLNFTLGNRVQLFPVGSTTLNVNAKWFDSEDPSQVAFNPAVVLTQNFNLGKYALSESFSYDINFADSAAYPKSQYDRADYRLTSALNIPEFFWQTALSVVLDITLVDTKNQFSTRGLEKTLSPSLILTRNLKSWLSVNLNYSYTNNISLDSVYYAYSKHVFGLGAVCRL